MNPASMPDLIIDNPEVIEMIKAISRFTNPALKVTLFTAIAMVSMPQVYAQTPEEKGLEIATEADTRDEGWGDSQAKMRMVLRNKAGKESVREVRLKNLEVIGDGDKSLSIFDRPADVKGTSFLSHTHVSTPDDQWLFLPALKRVKRISSANKSGPFMGSEFSYEDLSSQEVDKYTHTYIEDEELNGRATFKLEQIPTYEKSGYKKRITWIDKEHYYPVKIDFYDRKDTLLKTLEFTDYQQYLDKYWRAGAMLMKNHQNGKSTDLVWEDYEFAIGLEESDFTQAALKRAR